MRLPVHQRSLYPRRIHLRSGRLERAGLFPYFDRQGKVHAYMLVWPDSPFIVMLDAAEGLVVGRFPLTLDFELGRLQNLHQDRFDRYRHLWHYDPWWLLGEQRYFGHPAVPMLKATNAVEALGPAPWAGWFSGDLSRVVGDLRPYLDEPPAASKPPAGPPAWGRFRTRRTWPGLRDRL